MINLLYQGHASFRLRYDNNVIYIDPFAGEGYDLPADLVLITHEHRDHNDLKKIVSIKGPIIRSKDMVDGENYLSKNICGIDIIAVPAKNDFHKDMCCVGYVLKIKGKKLYFAGDTSTTRYMSEKLAKKNIDYAFLPCDGIYNMGINEAKKCSKLINARYTIPIHMKPGELFDSSIYRNFDVLNAIIMEPGIEFEL